MWKKRVAWLPSSLQPGLLGYLNQAGPTCPGGGPWTEEAYKTLMARLGA